MATTGRAAARMTELAARAGIDLSLTPGTIHRVLGLFARTQPKLPPGPAIAVIDEASMLDVETAGQALKELPTGRSVASARVKRDDAARVRTPQLGLAGLLDSVSNRPGPAPGAGLGLKSLQVPQPDEMSAVRSPLRP